MKIKINKSKIFESIKEILPWIIFLGVMLVIIYFGMNVREEQLSEIDMNKKFTIAITNGEYKSGKAGWKIRYKFYYNGNWYEDDCALDKTMKKYAGKYYVIFSSINPDNSELLKIPVSIAFKDLTQACWDTIPENTIEVMTNWRKYIP